MAAHLELTTKFGPPFDVRNFSIHEKISAPYEVYVRAQSTDPDIQLEALVNQQATFSMHTANDALSVPKRTWKGICQRAQHVRTEQGFNDGTAYSTYVLHIVPRLWLASTNRNQRIFQRLTLPEIVEKLLSEWDVDYKLDLKASYEKLDYIVQYGESDLVFIGRMLERAGITYYFDHDGGKEGLLTLADEPHNRSGRPPITYDDKRAEREASENVHMVSFFERVGPQKVTVRDFDFRNPAYELKGEAPSKEPAKDRLELYRYRPGVSLAVGKATGASTPTADDKGAVRSREPEVLGYAQRELEAHAARKVAVMFTTNCIDLAPGVVFWISGHPYPMLGPSLLVTEFTLSGSTEGEFQQSGTAVLANVPYRPERRQPGPMMQGVQSAEIVTRSMMQEVYTDEYGRVRLHFHWDRESSRNANSSMWTRVNQPWAGRGFGKVMIPRAKQEVLVRYEDGDPNHPFVIGRLYNAAQVISQEASLPTYDTRTSWMSDTSPHWDNSYNTIQFEDARDAEHIYIQAQRNAQKLVKNDETERTGQNRLLLVGNNRQAIVAGVDARFVGKKFSLQMMRASDLKILDMGVPNVTPRPTKLEMVDGKVLVTSKDASAMFKGKDITFEAKKSITLKAGGSIIVHGAPNIHINPKGGGGSGKLDGQAVPQVDDPIVGTLGAPTEVPAVEPAMAPYEPEPEPEPIAEPPPPEEEPDCELIKTIVKCGHGRTPNMDPSDRTNFRVLQIVPRGAGRTAQANINTWAGGAGPYAMDHKHYGRTGGGHWFTEMTGDTITFESSVSAPCERHGEWTWKGPGLDGREQTDSHQLQINPWVKNATAAGFFMGSQDISPNAKKRPIDLAVRGFSWASDADPYVYILRGGACDESHEYRIEAFPCDKIDIKFTFDLTKVWGMLGRWGQWFGDLVVKRLGERAGASISSNIVLNITGQWKEAGDWRAYYAYDVALNGEPLIGASIDYMVPLTAMLAGPVGVAIQLALRDYCDLGSLHIKVAGEIAGGITFACNNPDQTKPSVGGKVQGIVTISVFVEAFLWSRWVASARVEGRSTIELTLAPDGDRRVTQPPAVKVTFNWHPLTIEVQAGVLWWHKSKSWDIWEATGGEDGHDWGSIPVLPDKFSRYLGLSA